MTDALVVATDLTTSARATYPLAATWARALGARVILVHVDELLASGFGPADLYADYLQTLQDVRADRVREAMRDFDALGAPMSLDVRATRSTSDGIEAAVKEHAPTLVVLGRHGDHPILDRVLGSTTSRLLGTLTVPTLVVPRPEPGPSVADAPPAGGLEAASIRRILCASDVSALSEAVAGRAADIARMFDAELFILQITSTAALAAMATRGGDMMPVAMAVGMQQNEIATRALKALAESVGQGLQVHPLVAHGGPVSALVDACHSQEIDVVVLGAGASFLERLTLGTHGKAVAMRVPAAVLVLPKVWLEAEEAPASRPELAPRPEPAPATP
jgi:nucleotide-binding universal stress UspA family protein